MKIGAVILVAGSGMADEEIREYLDMKRPTIFEQMILNYQRAGVTDIVMVTQGAMADAIEQSLLRRGVTFLNIVSDKFDDAVRKGLSYLSEECRRIFVGDIRFPFFRPETLEKILKHQADLLGAGYGGIPSGLICVSHSCARDICEKLEQKAEERTEESDIGIIAFWKQFGHPIIYEDVEDAGVIVKVSTAQDYIKRRSTFEERQIRGSVKVSLAVDRSFFGPGVVTLLTQIDRLGSVREACAKTGMSYSKGWKLIHTAEEETGWKIVDRTTGGRNGGEACITECGRILLQKYELYRERVEEAAQEIYKDIFLDGELF